MDHTTVAVTGASGFLGQRLLSLLDADRTVERVVGIDVRDPARRVGKLRFHRADLATVDLKPLLEGVDVVVHLGSIRDPIPDEALMARVNVDGTRRLLDAVSAAGVRRVVRPSSAAVYGAWPNNPVPLTEQAPLRPNPNYAPALHDAEAERLLSEWRREHPGVAGVVLRMAPVVGVGAGGLLARAATGRPPVVVRGAARPVQVVHVDDAAAALHLAVTREVDGPLNVAADSWLAREEADALVGRRPFPGLPLEAAERMLRVLWSSGLGDAPPGVLPYLVHPWVVANDRLRAAGWEPRHSNEEAILLGAGVGERRSPLPWVAAGAGVVSGAALTAWVLARRRRTP